MYTYTIWIIQVTIEGKDVPIALFKDEDDAQEYAKVVSKLPFPVHIGCYTIKTDLIF